MKPRDGASTASFIHGSVFLNIPETFNSNITASGGTLTFIGGPYTFFGNKQVFNEPLYGNSNLILTSATHSSEHMDVGGYVGSGLNFDITGNGPPFASLQIDHPSEFHGSLTVNLPTYGCYDLGYVAFMGLHATSVDLKGDMLEMFKGSKLVDSVRYFGSQTGIQFEQNSAGIMMSTSFGPYQAPGGTETIIPCVNPPSSEKRNPTGRELGRITPAGLLNRSKSRGLTGAAHISGRFRHGGSEAGVDSNCPH